MIQFILNDKTIATDLPAGMVLLDFIRYHQHLTGTKIGCREGDCGACTILVGEITGGELQYESMTSCLLPLGNVQGKHIVTIEGINFPGQLNPIQQAMADCGATQCGFCTPGFVMSLAGFCLSDKKPTYENAIAAIDGNICRCTGYKSIEKAAKKTTEIVEYRGGGDPAIAAAKSKILPEYFAQIKTQLSQLETAPPATRYPPLAVGGGTDLYVQKHDEMTHADIQFMFDKMNSIIEEDGKCILGPSVTVTDLKNSPLINRIFPDFQRYAKLVSSTPIRNMATIAGNFVNASPIGDFTIFFLALDASLSLTLSEGEGTRTVSLRNFYKGYKQLDKKPNEIISKIWFEIPGKDFYFNFEKVSKRTHLDIASVNSACLLTMNGDTIEKASVSAGGVGPVPVYLQKTSAYLKGKTLREPQGDKIIDAAIEIMKTEISPISDARGSKEYKTLLLGQLIKAHLGPPINTK
ncbi:MAG: 2Fe-2S iron-sulfur cluster binding domain-containing protein [Chitinophagaceae bacterium]|nr:2Fe-2S iron-sulfur cluster binding domain-containing protein [Chitinophagaceae bacterium]